jgi:hypothetical protein
MDLERNVLTSLAANVSTAETSGSIRDATSTVGIVHSGAMIIVPPLGALTERCVAYHPPPQRDGRTLTNICKPHALATAVGTPPSTSDPNLSQLCRVLWTRVVT